MKQMEVDKVRENTTMAKTCKWQQATMVGVGGNASWNT
jgi:hypothetical protein